MRIALVVQRYGEDVAGGAELHARYVAELLAAEHEVTVLTTTARDYVSWAEHYPAGESTLHGVAVRRFPVERRRDALRFARASALAFAPGHSAGDEARFLEEQGPWAPELWRRLAADRARYDAVIAFSFRYVTTAESARVMPARTLLVPTAEDDPAVTLDASRALFRSMGAIAWNSPEERELVTREAGELAAAADVVGVFSRVPAAADPKRFRDRHRIEGPYLLYVGRIDRNKGCGEMFDHFTAFLAETGLPHQLLLVGQAVMDLPAHPQVRHLGFLSDEEKFDALAGADLLLVPSPFESLSMVTLEAMALGVVPLVYGGCAVLRGQVRRANAGLHYDGYDEFVEAARLLLATPRLRRILGASGRRYYQESYAPEVIAAKYRRLLDALRR